MRGISADRHEGLVRSFMCQSAEVGRVGTIHYYVRTKKGGRANFFLLFDYGREIHQKLTLVK